MFIQTGSSPYIVIVNDDTSLGITPVSYGVAVGAMVIPGTGSFSSNTGQCNITPAPGEISAVGQVFFVSLDGSGNIVGRLECQVVSYDPATGPSGSSAVLAAVQPYYAPAKAGDAMTLLPVERNALALVLLTLADGVETGFSIQQALRVIGGILGGNRQTAGLVSISRNMGDTLDRATATLDPIAQTVTVVLNLA